MRFDRNALKIQNEVATYFEVPISVRNRNLSQIRIPEGAAI
jgi:predicted component of type VI protein secretion system